MTGRLHPWLRQARSDLAMAAMGASSGAAADQVVGLETHQHRGVVQSDGGPLEIEALVRPG